MYNFALARDLYNNVPILNQQQFISRYITTGLLPSTTNFDDYKKYISSWKNIYEWSIDQLLQIKTIPSGFMQIHTKQLLCRKLENIFTQSII